MVDKVNFAAGMLSNAYRLQFGTMRGMRDRGRGMCF
jgi:hypothetical protein